MTESGRAAGCDPELVTGYVDGALDPTASGRRSRRTSPSCAGLPGAGGVDAERALARPPAGAPPAAARPDVEARVAGRAGPRAPAARAPGLLCRWPRSLVLLRSGSAARRRWWPGSWRAITRIASASGKLPAQVWTEDPASSRVVRSPGDTTMPVVPRPAGGSGSWAARYCPLLDLTRRAPLLRRRASSTLSVFVLVGAARASTAASRERATAAARSRWLQVGGVTVGLVGDRRRGRASRAFAARGPRPDDRGAPPPVDRRASLSGRFGSSSRGAVAQLGARVNGIHEVTGSIPVSSTNSSNDLARRRSSAGSAVSTLCLFSRAWSAVDDGHVAFVVTLAEHVGPERLTVLLTQHACALQVPMPLQRIRESGRHRDVPHAIAMTSRPAWSAWSSTRARPSAPWRATWT